MEKRIEKSEQYKLMKQGKSYFIDEYLFGKQTECSEKLLKINALPFSSHERKVLLKGLLGSLGDNTVFKEGFRCNYGFNIFIGDNCFINFNLVILDSYEVHIGNNVFIAPNVLITPVTHPLVAKERRNLIIKKVVIEDDVWIGAGAVILPGVTLRRGAVIGAGAVVTKDVDADTVVAGVPAKVINTLDNNDNGIK